MLVELTVVTSHLEFALHRRVAIGLLDLVVARKENDTLPGGKQGELVLTSLVKRSQVQSGDFHTDERGDLLRASAKQWRKDMEDAPLQRSHGRCRIQVGRGRRPAPSRDNRMVLGQETCRWGHYRDSTRDT